MKFKGLHYVDVTKIQEAVTDELKKVQIQEFSAALRPHKRLYIYIYICQWSSF
jgi:hypothetical protein